MPEKLAKIDAVELAREVALEVDHALEEFAPKAVEVNKMVNGFVRKVVAVDQAHGKVLEVFAVEVQGI